MREFLYGTFNEYREQHPWIEEENVQPKSIARELYEDFLGFGEYVNRYKLQRAEGVLLRHLSQVYKVLVQTVPDTARTEAVDDVEEYLAEVIRGTDSSLLDEWERLRDPDYVPAGETAKPVRRAYDLTRDREAFLRRIRSGIFSLLKAVQTGTAADSEALAFEAYLEARGGFLLDPEARNRKHTYVNEDKEADSLEVSQILVDAEGRNDWEAVFRVDLEASRAAQEPVMGLVGVKPVENRFPDSG